MSGKNQNMTQTQQQNQNYNLCDKVKLLSNWCTESSVNCTAGLQHQHPTNPIVSPAHAQSLEAYRVAIQRLEVKVLICYAHVAGIGHQRHDHLHCTLHVRVLRDTLKALDQIPIIIIQFPYHHSLWFW